MLSARCHDPTAKLHDLKVNKLIDLVILIEGRVPAAVPKLLSDVLSQVRRRRASGLVQPDVRQRYDGRGGGGCHGVYHNDH